VIVGENGTGKTHVLKLAYSILATSFEEGRKLGATAPTKSVLQSRLAEKLVNVFRPESLGRLAQRQQGVQRCDVRATSSKSASNVAFSFTTRSSSEVTIETLPKEWAIDAPAYIPS